MFKYISIPHSYSIDQKQAALFCIERGVGCLRTSLDLIKNYIPEALLPEFLSTAFHKELCVKQDSFLTYLNDLRNIQSGHLKVSHSEITQKIESGYKDALEFQSILLPKLLKIRETIDLRFKEDSGFKAPLLDLINNILPLISPRNFLDDKPVNFSSYDAHIEKVVEHQTVARNHFETLKKEFMDDVTLCQQVFSDQEFKALIYPHHKLTFSTQAPILDQVIQLDQLLSTGTASIRHFELNTYDTALFHFSVEPYVSVSDATKFSYYFLSRHIQQSSFGDALESCKTNHLESINQLKDELKSLREMFKEKTDEFLRFIKKEWIAQLWNDELNKFNEDKTSSLTARIDKVTYYKHRRLRDLHMFLSPRHILAKSNEFIQNKRKEMPHLTPEQLFVDIRNNYHDLEHKNSELEKTIFPQLTVSTAFNPILNINVAQDQFFKLWKYGCEESLKQRPELKPHLNVFKFSETMTALTYTVLGLISPRLAAFNLVRQVMSQNMFLAQPLCDAMDTTFQSWGNTEKTGLASIEKLLGQDLKETMRFDQLGIYDKQKWIQFGLDLMLTALIFRDQTIAGRIYHYAGFKLLNTVLNRFIDETHHRTPVHSSYKQIAKGFSQFFVTPYIFNSAYLYMFSSQQVQDICNEAHQVLGTDKTMSFKDVIKTKRKLALKYHPDKGGDAKTMTAINNAFDNLSNNRELCFDQSIFDV